MLELEMTKEDPSDLSSDSEREEEESSEKLREEEEEEEEEKEPGNRKRNMSKQVKNKGSKPKKKVPLQKHVSSTDYISEDDDELMQVLLKMPPKERLENVNIQEDAGRKRRKKIESGSRFLTVRDLQRVATAHDFTWTDRELAEMVQCFYSDGDGKLNLDDFRKITGCCNMILGSGNC